MFIEAVLISILIGFIRKGRLRRLRFLNYRNMWVVVAGIAIQYILIFLNGLDDMGIINDIMLFSKEIQLLSYALILLGIISNIKYRSLWLILIGYASNFFVIWSNGWKMPILSEAIPLTNMASTNTALYTSIVEGTRFAMLGNVIVFANPYPLSKIISLGDLLVAFGLFILIQEIMLGKDSFMKRR